MNRRSFLRGAAVTISVMALAGRLKMRAPEQSSFGLASVKGEGETIMYDDVADAARYQIHAVYSTRQVL
jgi:hypothetical protein